MQDTEFAADVMRTRRQRSVRSFAQHHPSCVRCDKICWVGLAAANAFDGDAVGTDTHSLHKPGLQPCRIKIDLSSSGGSIRHKNLSSECAQLPVTAASEELAIFQSRLIFLASDHLWTSVGPS